MTDILITRPNLQAGASCHHNTTAAAASKQLQLNQIKLRK
jgi:hypothetical protein